MTKYAYEKNLYEGDKPSEETKQEALKHIEEKHYRNKYEGLTDEEFSVSGIVNYLITQKQEILLYQQKLLQSQDKQEIAQAATYDTYSQDFLIDVLISNTDINSIDTPIDIDHFDPQETFPGMGPREFGMFFGIFNGARKNMSSMHNGESTKLNKVLKNIEAFLDEYVPPTSSPYYGQPFVIYDEVGRPAGHRQITYPIEPPAHLQKK